MQAHVCSRSEDITKAQIDIEVTKSEVMTLKENIRDIKVSIKEGNEKIVTLLYWLMGFIGTSLIAIIGFIISRGVK